MAIYEDIGTGALLVVFTCLVIVVFRKLLENRKRKSLNDASSSKSGHYWTPIEVAEHGYFCACCQRNLTAGYECDYCMLKVDNINCVKQISTKLLCKVNHVRNAGSDEQMKHHWVPGNIDEAKFCLVCDELCGCGIGLKDYRCSWCTRVVHTKCFKKAAEGCDLGSLRQFTIPPVNVVLRKPGNRNQRLPVIDSLTVPGNVLNWVPVIAIVNPKSGSGAGKNVLRKLRAHLHPAQVIDVTKCNMKSSIQWVQEYADLNTRILIAGGDGTISLVLDDIDKLTVRPPVAILPLGTGNDLSRVLGWGKQNDGTVDVLQVLEDVAYGKPVKMDRWTISIQNRRKLGLRLADKNLSMTNYVSIGVDACVTLGMQTTRSSLPRALSSRMINKFLFFTYGTKDVFERACNGLQNNIDLYLDGSETPCNLPEVEGLVFLNIGCWGAGVRPWTEAPEEWPQSINDGKFEIFAVRSSFHIAQLQVGMSSPILIGQAKSVKLVVKHGNLPMQSDGEAWSQPPATIMIQRKCSSYMIEKIEPTLPKERGFF